MYFSISLYGYIYIGLIRHVDYTGLLSSVIYIYETRPVMVIIHLSIFVDILIIVDCSRDIYAIKCVCIQLAARVKYI